MKRLGIYQIRNLINQNIYVGSTVKFVNRKNGHFKQLKNNQHHSILLQRAYNKYGEQNFIFEILEYVEDKTKLIEREQYYFDTLKPQYNICKIAGNTLGCKMSEESKQKRLKTLKDNGYKVSEETKRKRSLSLKGKKSWNEGKRMPIEVVEKTRATKLKNGTLNQPRSENWRKKISESNKGKIVSKETRDKQRLSHLGQVAWNKGISCSDETKEKISISKKNSKKTSWNKGIPMSDEVRIKLSKVNKGRKQSQLEKDKRAKSLSKSIIQSDLHGNFIAEFPSVMSAMNTTNIKSISQALTGRTKSAGQCLWTYKID